MPLNADEMRHSTERAVNGGETTLVPVPGVSEGEALVTTTSMPPATDISPSSTSVATGSGAAGCVLRVAAGRAAEASLTVIASIRNGGRSSSATAGTLAVLAPAVSGGHCWMLVNYYLGV